MRLTRNAVLAGLASLAVAGAAVAAEKPAKPEARAMAVALPDEGVVRISYSGDVAPLVSIGKGAADVRAAGFDPAPFAAMDRIMAEMDARAAQMMSRMRDMQVRMAAAARAAGSGDPGAMRWVSLPGFGPAAVASLPPGAVSYSSVTTMSGGRSCTRTVQVTRTAADAAPQVVRRASGDCGSAADPAPAAAPPAPRTVAAPRPAKPAAPRPDRVI